MAKKASAKSKRPAPKKHAARLAENTVELHLPTGLYGQVSSLDARVLKHLLRAIFDHDNLFGVTQVVIKEATRKDASKDGDSEPKKVCDGP